jgi:hypothetical protein
MSVRIGKRRRSGRRKEERTNGHRKDGEEGRMGGRNKRNEEERTGEEMGNGSNG